MLLALDSYYKDNICNTSLVVFNENEDVAIYTDTRYSKVTSEYIPGEFYKRELPGIKKILRKFIRQHPELWEQIHAVIVDSYITLKTGDKEWKGLGGHLDDYLTKYGHHKIIYGVAKSKFGDCDKISDKVLRGKSEMPLYVQTTGAPHIAAYQIARMHGKFRIPTMLKLVDQLSRKFNDEILNIL